MEIIDKTNPSILTNHPNKRGVAMLAAVCVLVVIGLFAVQFHKMSREAQLNAYKFQASESARQLAESAMDEAFTYVFNQTAKQGTDIFNNIVNNPTSPSAMDCTSGTLEDKNSKGVAIPVPLTANVAASMNMADRFNIEVTARIIDFRNGDDTGRKFYGNEGVGTLELRARVTPKEEKKKYTPGACTITRHHDYKVVSIISKRTSRPAGYVQNQLLDYALFITRGREEFENEYGSNLNPQETRFIIDQNGFTPSSPDVYGKVYLGGTSGMGGKPVFIDTTEDTKTLIPGPLSEDNVAPPSPVSNLDCLSLIPEIYNEFNAAAKEIFDREKPSDGDPKYKRCIIDGLSGNFFYKRLPVADAAINAAPFSDSQKTSAKNARTGAWADSKSTFVPKDPSAPFSPGLVIEPMAQLSNIIQGKIRKRFLHFGYFILDMSNAELAVVFTYKRPFRSRKTATTDFYPLNKPEIVEQYRNLWFPTTPDVPELRNNKFDIQFLANRFPHPKIISNLNSDYDYVPGTEKDKFPSPRFYSYSNSMLLDGTDLAVNEFRPFSHAALWIRRDFPAERLEEYGIYKNGELHLRGIIRTYGHVTLRGKNGNPLKVHGQGVLIADGISIESGIEKADADSLCVLAVRGAGKDGNVSNQTIWVKTDDKIEASLVAVGYGHGCRVIPENNRLNLFGSLAVDKLDINRWKKNVEHRVTYDPLLACDKDLYAVNLSRWISFTRMMESDD